MLVINKIGPTKIKSVKLASDVVVVRLVSGTEILYKRIENNESSEKIQIRCCASSSRL